MTTTSKKQPDTGRAWDTVEWAARVLIVGLIVFSLRQEWRITQIESNRFTHTDGVALERRLLEKLPPQWLRDELVEIKGNLRGVETRLRSIEQKVK